MRNSNIDPAIELKEKLFEIPELVSALANKENNVCHTWINWLIELESTFKKYNYPQCAEVAGFRALIISNSMDKVRGTQRKRQQIKTALSTVQPIQQLLTQKSKELNQKIDQVRILLRQILIPARDAGLINYNTSINFTSFMESLLDQLRTHKQIGHEINNAIALIGKYDVLRILAEEIEVK